MSQEPKINKTTAYLAATGAFATGAFLLTAAPFVTIPLVVAAGAAVAVRKDRAEIVERVKNEAKELWQDLSTYATQDFKKLRSWWNSYTAKAEAPAAPKSPVASEAPSTFDAAATSKNDFAQNASPQAETAAPVAEQKPAPAAAPAAPKPPAP